jgi:hypothetical protein
LDDVLDLGLFTAIFAESEDPERLESVSVGADMSGCVD